MQSILLRSENPDASPLLLHLHLEAMLNVSGAEARSLVNRRIVPILGTGLIARMPELAVTESKIQWRVPVSLSLPSLGDLGQVFSSARLVSPYLSQGLVLTTDY